MAFSAARGVGALLDALRPTTPDAVLNQPISARRHLAWVHRRLGDLKRVKRRFDATINDVLLASQPTSSSLIGRRLFSRAITGMPPTDFPEST